ncbi:hypothetical protein OYE22_18490 [Streptomyces sp. 71268]|uniref:hypothetical protein n=1 Tax=Streptomyces sp. 71268 TaxID=3002640 RepID=UPI0023F99F85|nr:hypothetical protein [Streptomyces sp. 71268]WEV26968.1 hypothetical protein OYE22_18490 [Streptomyces sp. 71268]
MTHPERRPPADAQLTAPPPSQPQRRAQRPRDVPPADSSRPPRRERPASRARVLTGQHTVRTVAGVVLRFFLADARLSDPACGWEAVTDAEFQYAYEASLFDREPPDQGRPVPNPERVQVTLDALVGPGSFCWVDGCVDAGIMTTNGKAPVDCGLGLTDVRALAWSCWSGGRPIRGTPTGSAPPRGAPCG